MDVQSKRDFLVRAANLTEKLSWKFEGEAYCRLPSLESSTRGGYVDDNSRRGVKKTISFLILIHRERFYTK